MEFQKLYKQTATGATQVWFQEINPVGDSFRTVSGQLNGKLVYSEWTVCTAKNIGKANGTTPQQQCQLEVEANYKKKLAQGNYKDSLDEDSLSQDNYVKPMLAKKFGEDYTPTSVDYTKGLVYSQPKLDGIRCIATQQGLFSRQGKSIVSAPHIHEALKPLFDKYPGLVFDGELYTDKLVNDFNKIISLTRKTKPTIEDLKESRELIQYHVYDLVAAQKTTKASFADRYEFLDGLIAELNSDYVALVETKKVRDTRDLDELFQVYLEMGYEGQMVRLSTTPYENKRTKQLLKRKEFEEEEFLIHDIEEGTGNRSGMAGTIYLKKQDGAVFGSGVRGNRDSYRELLQNKTKYIGTLASVRFQNYTPDGVPRFPVVVKFWMSSKREY
jgi:DNA ligase-1